MTQATHTENLSTVGNIALNRLSLEGFKNLRLLRTANEKSLLELLGPLVLTPICRSFFQSFLCFDRLV